MRKHAPVQKVKNYKEIKDLYILGDTSEVVANLDDSLVTINTVLSSRYVGGIRGMVDEWRGKLVTLQVWWKTGGSGRGGGGAHVEDKTYFGLTPCVCSLAGKQRSVLGS